VLRLASKDEARAAAMAQIRQFGDPVLKEESHHAEADDELRKLVERMIRIMHDAEGVGLAAPQIGILRKIIVFHLDDEDHVLINPEITWRSEESITDSEGCLSLANMAVDVERAAKIRVEGQDLEGNKKVFELEGLQARILQHEIDHLHGTMVINRTTREQRRQLMARLREVQMRD
jgi:peptide deformylase